LQQEYNFEHTKKSRDPTLAIDAGAALKSAKNIVKELSQSNMTLAKKENTSTLNEILNFEQTQST